MYTLIPTLAFALPEIFSNFFDRPIESQPLTFCVLGIFCIVLIRISSKATRPSFGGRASITSRWWSITSC